MNYWWAFEGTWFKEDNEGDYLYAPQYDKKGRTPFYWENLSKVKKGDYFLSYVHGDIKAVGIVCEDTKTTNKNPRSGTVQPGWIAKADRTILDKPFHTIDVWDNKNNKNNNTKPLFMDKNGKMKKYMPLKSDGKGNNGFLYKIDKKIFTTYLDYIKKNCSTDLSKFVN